MAMNNCQRCGGRTQLSLCNACTQKLQALLADLPWLLKQLDTTVQRQDRLTTGNTIGSSTAPPATINLDAMDTARNVRITLLAIFDAITIQPAMPKLRMDHVPTPDIARTLSANAFRIAHHPNAGEFYSDIAQLIEDDEIGRAGPMWKAINRTEKLFAGPCPTIKGYDQQGQPIRCSTILYADGDEKIARCPRCDADIDVAKNRLQAAVDRDLLPEAKLLEVMADIGQKVSRVKFYDWIRAGRITPQGWMHDKKIVPFRIRRGDPRVFSLARAKTVWAQDQEAKSRKQQEVKTS